MTAYNPTKVNRVYLASTASLRIGWNFATREQAMDSPRKRQVFLFTLLLRPSRRVDGLRIADKHQADVNVTAGRLNHVSPLV